MAKDVEQEQGAWRVLAGISSSQWIVFKGDPMKDDYQGFLASNEPSANALAKHLSALEAENERLRTALRRIAFEDDVAYMACSDVPYCRGGEHYEDCAVGIAREALSSSTPKEGLTTNE